MSLNLILLIIIKGCTYYIMRFINMLIIKLYCYIYLLIYRLLYAYHFVVNFTTNVTYQYFIYYSFVISKYTNYLQKLIYILVIH